MPVLAGAVPVLLATAEDAVGGEAPEAAVPAQVADLPAVAGGAAGGAPRRERQPRAVPPLHRPLPSLRRHRQSRRQSLRARVYLLLFR